MTDQQRIAEIRARATYGLESYRKKYPANWRGAYILDGDRDTLWLLSQLAAKDKEIERLTEAARWIPVSERLPKIYQGENGEPIEFNVLLPEATEATTMCFNGSQWFEMIWSEMRVGAYRTVTHWMPLPAPPEKGE